jgi:hypothetical protein
MHVFLDERIKEKIILIKDPRSQPHSFNLSMTRVKARLRSLKQQPSTTDRLEHEHTHSSKEPFILIFRSKHRRDKKRQQRKISSPSKRSRPLCLGALIRAAPTGLWGDEDERMNGCGVLDRCRGGRERRSGIWKARARCVVEGTANAEP